MKTFVKSVVVAFVATLVLAAAVPALAMTPTLTVTREGNYGDVRITVRGDAWSRIDEMGYRTGGSNLWTQVTNLGQLDSGGYFTQIFSVGNTSQQAEFYVTVNGQRSSTAWIDGSGNGCYYGNNCTGSLSLSQTSLNLNVGQSATVSAYNAGNIYISSNSNSSVATASVSGSQIYVYGNNPGSATISVCSGSTYTTVGCASIFVTVGGGSSGNITFSQSSVSLTVGQSATVNIYGNQYNYNYNNYYVASNSNSNVVSASISGSQLSLYGLQSGSANLSICQSGGSCGNVYVTVSGYSSGNIYFSPSSVSISQNQSTTVNIYNNTSSNYQSYYISSNSNSSVVSASISGSSLYLNGLANGSSTITVCSSGYSTGCGSLNVTVSGSQGGGSFWLSQSSVNLSVGQSANIQGYTNQAMTGWNMYVSSNSNSSVASASISGSNITIYGNQSGSTTMSICHSGAGQCQSLYVTVGGGYSGNLYFNSTYLPQAYVNQYYSTQLQVSGGSTPYTYMVSSGNLPAGLSLSSGGQIFGTPTYSNSATFTIRVQDYYGRTATQSFTLQPVCQSGYGCVQGTGTYRSGQLISENGTVYIVYRNTKTGFASRWVFDMLGFNMNNVVNTGSTGLADTGYTISNAYAAHPWGTWIKSGNTVYFVHEQGLIPVPDYNTFLNNSGSDNLVVTANSWDFQRPMLSVMQQNDWRLR